jgi:putative flippase GtrA
MLPAGMAMVRGLAGRVDATVVRWFGVSVFCMGCDFAVLYLLVGVVGLAPALGNLLVAESSNLIRFLLTDRVVFGHRRPTWRRLWQFHLSSAGAFAVWWASATLLTSLGVHYLLSAAAANGCSVGVNMLAHFGWIWRAQRRAADSREVAAS